MDRASLADFVGGWFVGNFEPTLVRTESFEAAVKLYTKGATEAAHYQLTAWEITVVIQGTILLGGELFSGGDIAIIPPGEIASFEAIEDCTLVCLKSPSLPADKVVA
jgi:quercetin dioxygenase-like cupin family protein